MSDRPIPPDTPTPHSPLAAPSADEASKRTRRVMVLGATGTIGQATTRALAKQGYRVVCLVRHGLRNNGPEERSDHGLAHGPPRAEPPENVELRNCDVTSPASLARDGFRGEQFDAVVSCLASRTGEPRDAWAIDHRAHMDALTAAKAAGVGHFVLLSAICVQKPRLAFQHAKLAFEKALMESGLVYSIVRPTAYFKSLSGQIERVRAGKPFLVFGDGRLTACKPISDDDLADYIAGCLDDERRHDRILPIGGPGPAITPRDQAEAVFALLGRQPHIKQVPVGLLSIIAGALGVIGRVVPALATKAELARIGHYYATESMLLIDPATGHYDAEVTPSHGRETLFDFYARLVSGEAKVERGEHAVF